MRWLLLFFAFLVPELVWAQAAGGSYASATSGFTLVPPPTDLSVYFLSDIFGLVDGVLHGTGSQILGTMFGVFNAFILTIAGVLITYILFVSTLNTAHDGKVLGQKWSSIWIPIRAVVGIGALVPKASGYCFIQIFLMWVVVQGVGAADSIWYAALNYFQRGGILVQHAQFVVSQNTPETKPILIFSAGGVLKSETCMYTLRNSLLNLPPTPGQPPVPDFNTSLIVTGQPSNLSPPCYKGDTRPGCPAAGDAGGVIFFPGNVSYAGTSLQGACGNVSWSFIKNAQGNVENTAINAANLGAYDPRSVAAQQVVLSMQSLAYTLAQILLPVGPNQTGRNLTNGDLVPNGLVNPARDYIAIIRPALNVQGQQAAAKVKETLDRAALNGWILAGSYYFTLANLNRQFTASEQNPPTTTYPNNYDPNIFRPAALAVLSANLTNATINNCSTLPPNILDNFICSEYQNAITLSEKGFTPSYVVPPPGPGQSISGTVPWWQRTVGAQASFTPPGAGWTGFRPQIPKFTEAHLPFQMEDAINTIPSAINAIFDEMTKNIRALFESQTSNLDPIIGISNLGNQILTWVEWLWLGGAVTLFFVGAIATCAAANPVFSMMSNLLMWLVPMLTGVMMAMFVAGMIMAYYIPLIPMIIFTFTAIGWFVAVIESMVAGPLVALGLISPEGHEYFGQAQNSIMLILNLFVRPSLIIFGFISAAILSHVGLWLFNTALGVTMTSEFIKGSAFSPVVTHVLSVVAIILVYMTVVLSIVNRSFALIHEIPSHVLTWIGGNIRQFGEQEGARGVEAAIEPKFGVAKGGAESVVGGTHAAGKTAVEMGRKRGEARAKKQGEHAKPS